MNSDIEAWETTSGWDDHDLKLADKSLNQLLLEGDTSKDKEEQYSAIAIRTAPPVFRPLIRDVKQTYRRSFSQVVRLALKHGTAILSVDPRMKRLRDVFLPLRQRALEKGNNDALIRIGRVYPFDYQNVAECHTSLSVATWVLGEISELSDMCRMYQGQLAVIAALVSMYTLPNERGYKDLIRKEIDSFWKAIDRRRRELSL